MTEDEKYYLKSLIRQLQPHVKFIETTFSKVPLEKALHTYSLMKRSQYEADIKMRLIQIKQSILSLRFSMKYGMEHIIRYITWFNSEFLLYIPPEKKLT